jgi:hypothetical protein
MESPDGGRGLRKLLESLPGRQRQALADLTAIDALAQPGTELELMSGCMEQADERVRSWMKGAGFDPADGRLRHAGALRQ